MPLQKPERKHVEVKLSEPLKLDTGDTVRSVYVLRPRAGEMRAMPVPVPGSKLTAGDFYPIVSSLCGLTEAEFDRLDSADGELITKLVMQTAAAFPPTGTSASPTSPPTSLASGATTS